MNPNFSDGLLDSFVVANILKAADDRTRIINRRNDFTGIVDDPNRVIVIRADGFNHTTICNCADWTSILNCVGRSFGRDQN